jgi:hypothetical protein
MKEKQRRNCDYDKRNTSMIIYVTNNSYHDNICDKHFVTVNQITITTATL